MFLRYWHSNRKAIIDLAKAFNLTLVSEGLETPARMNALLSLGCDYAQGHLFKNKIKFRNPASFPYSPRGFNESGADQQQSPTIGHQHVLSTCSSGGRSSTRWISPAKLSRRDPCRRSPIAVFSTLSSANAMRASARIQATGVETLAAPQGHPQLALEKRMMADSINDQGLKRTQQQVGLVVGSTA